MADHAQRQDLSEKAGYGSATTPPGDLTSPTRQTPPRVSPNSPFRQGNLKDSWRAGLATGWGPCFDAMFPPARVTAWINFQRMSTGVNPVSRLTMPPKRPRNGASHAPAGPVGRQPRGLCKTCDRETRTRGAGRERRPMKTTVTRAPAEHASVGARQSSAPGAAGWRYR